MMEKVFSIPNDTSRSQFMYWLFRIDMKYDILARIGMSTGLRISDILALRVSDISQEIKIVEKKTGKSNVVKLSRALLDHVLWYVKTYPLSDGDALIPSSHTHRDKPLSRTQAYRVLSSVGCQIGLPHVGTHSMRKTFAQDLFVKSESISRVQEALHHKYPETTLTYLTDKTFSEISKMILGPLGLDT